MKPTFCKYKIWAGILALMLSSTGVMAQLVAGIYVVQQATCHNVCNGIIAVSPTGGTGPYTYIWSTGQTTDTIQGLCAGQYHVTITDGVGATVTAADTILQPTALSIAGNTTANGSCIDSAIVVVTGGTPSYTYHWFVNSFSVINPSPILSGQCSGNK